MAFKNLFKVSKDKKVESSKVEPSKGGVFKNDEVDPIPLGGVVPTKEQVIKHEETMEKIKAKGGLSDFRKSLHEKQKLAREAKQPIYPKV